MESKSLIYYGVSFNKTANKWTAQIRHNGQRIHLGYFTNESEAARAFDQKAIELFKVFAKLNF